MNRPFIYVAVPLIVIFGLYASKSQVARTAPGIVSYYSFGDGIFTFQQIYTDGSVGPFRIGATKMESIHDLSKYAADFRLPMSMDDRTRDQLYFTKLNHVTPLAEKMLLERDVWRVSTRNFGAATNYTIEFHDGRCAKVRLLSSLMS